MEIFRVSFDHINSHGGERIISGEALIEANDADEAREIARQDLHRLTGNFYEVEASKGNGLDLSPLGVYHITLREHDAVPVSPKASPVSDEEAES